MIKSRLSKESVFVEKASPPQIWNKIKKPTLISSLIFIVCLALFSFFFFKNVKIDLSLGVLIGAPILWFAILFIPVIVALYSGYFFLSKFNGKRKCLNVAIVYFLIGCSTALLTMIITGIRLVFRGWDDDLIGFLFGGIILIIQLFFLIPNYVYFYNKNKKDFKK